MSSFHWGRTALLGTAFALTVALSACAGGSAGTGTTAGTDAEPAVGGDLTFALANDPISLNPSGTGSGNDTWYVTRQLVDSLLYQNPDTNELEPWLAKSWEANADATVFTFELRDDVTFSDGTPFTAADVKGTFDDIIAAGPKSQAVSSFVGYQETTVLDDYTVQVTFSTPNSAFPNSTSSVPLGIVGAATLAVPYDDRANGADVVGTGPFVLNTYTKDVETVLDRRDGYAWSPASRDLDGEAYLDSVTFPIVPEPAVRTGSLTSGQVDVIGGVQPVDVETLTASSFPLVSRGNPGVSFGEYFNLSRPIVADIAVREAIAHATNATEIRDTALNDEFNVGTSILAATTPGYADESDYFEFDPKTSAKLLDGAGWKLGDDGIREKDGTRLSLVVNWITNFGPNQTSLELLQQQLKDVGIELTLQGGDVPSFLEKQTSGDFDISWQNLSRADGDVLRTTFSSAAANTLRIDDPTLEALLQEQLATGDPAARADVLADAQERIASQYYQIPVHELTSILATQPDVGGVTLGADSRLDQLTGAWTAAE
ncbi:ABC transporter substrate-binding protein [Cryobacterium sp.]|jgi:peptide/nickel transport system substrate-binding protein|uniref:ABC transporter substrate-binding protein n=1 Tax=Cryobacterium sp. TaxID=1926290 RepID=UPI00260C86F0|nr:ABC transporter substrate-binding protein [Cryobacterium sp.]MCU1446214.1 ABC-type dipeptide transport system, periplasmic component [Cryobacterium sp.]